MALVDDIRALEAENTRLTDLVADLKGELADAKDDAKAALQDAADAESRRGDMEGCLTQVREHLAAAVATVDGTL